VNNSFFINFLKIFFHNILARSTWFQANHFEYSELPDILIDFLDLWINNTHMAGHVGASFYTINFTLIIFIKVKLSHNEN